ncbi:MAG: TIGR02391 family protein [Streptosporangiaceae bacterium]
MNRDMARDMLAKYVERVELAQSQSGWSKERRATMKGVNAIRDMVNFYLRDLLPDYEPVSGTFLNDHLRTLPRVRRAIALLEVWQEMASGQDDERFPAVLQLDRMDWVVSSAAIPMWEAEKYRQAVSDAATRLNAFTQNRLGRHDISDSALMAEAFSLSDPQEGKPRLRCPGDQSSVTGRSMQQGALQMSQGCFQAIRNPAVHLDGGWNPITAAEYLAVLSVVARWVRHWNVIQYVPPLPDLSLLQLDPATRKAILAVARTTEQSAQPKPTSRP